MKIKYLLIASLITAASTSFSQTKNATDSIKVAVYPPYNKVSGLHKMFWGKNYRQIWATPVKMKVFYLEKEQGGLTITELGGGNQTQSLKLKDSSGHEWALRTVEKFPERALAKNLKYSVVKDILKDQVSTSHPYAALIVPPLAEALGIPHTHPQIVYVPDDPALGKYRKDFANKVFLFEEREPLDGKETDKTEKVQDKLQDNNDTRADQKLLLRARLLDMVMGDWDRHGGQWRWEKEKDSIGTMYKPLPNDRDKVFYSTSGIFPWFAAHSKPQLQPYKEHIKHIGKWNLNNIYFDLYFLNQLSEADWNEQINYVQSKLTDDVITNAIKLLPPNIYQLSGKELTRITIARRNNIKENALEYYRFLAKNVDVAASDKNEQFTIEQQSEGRVNVIIQKIKKDSAIGRIVYQRNFDPKATKEIRLYGMGGKDAFSVTGNQPSPIKVRMIGGNDEDTFTVDNNLHNKSKLYVYDRSDEKNNLPGDDNARILTATDTSVNQYDKNAFKYDHFAPLISLGYNTEDGVRLIGGYVAEKHGFRKEPYAYRQELQVGYTLSKTSFIFTYKGDFKKIWGNSDLGINILSRGPRNVNNFFGLGNEVVFDRSEGKSFDYYRNRYDYTLADVRLYQQHGKWEVSEGIVGQYYTSAAVNNTELFFNQYNQQHPELNLFTTKIYTGLIAGAAFDTRDSHAYPTKGVYWKTTLTGSTGVNVSDHTNGQIFSTFNFYLNPDNNSVFVIADRTGAGTVFGKAEFFQMMNLGGPLSLQGYHTSRFIGKSMVFNNLEFRLKLFDFNTYLVPGTLGLIVFNDAGRVWLPGEVSNSLHDAYGGGLYIKPFNKFLLSAVIGHSPDGSLLYLAGGVRF